MGISLTQATAFKLKELLNKSHGMKNGGQRFYIGQRQCTHVFITDAPDGMGYYPCVPVAWIEEDQSYDAFEDALAMHPSGGILEVGEVYLALKYGDRLTDASDSEDVDSDGERPSKIVFVTQNATAADSGGSPSVASSWKEPVRCATTTNGTLSTAFAAGQIVDGVTLATGYRILLKNQTTTNDNGIYVVNASGAPTRSADGSVSIGIGGPLDGAMVAVQQGTANKGTVWECSEDFGGNPRIWTLVPGMTLGTQSGAAGFIPIWTTANGERLGATSHIKFTDASITGEEIGKFEFFSGALGEGGSYGPGMTLNLTSFVAGPPTNPILTIGTPGSASTLGIGTTGFAIVNASNNGPGVIGSYATSGTFSGGNESNFNVQGGGTDIGVITANGNTGFGRFDVATHFAGGAVGHGLTGSVAPGAQWIGGILTYAGSPFSAIPHLSGGASLSDVITKVNAILTTLENANIIST
jgi:hypothetical protein